MAFITDSNRPQPVWQPPPTADFTASGAASEVPSLLMRPCPSPNRGFLDPNAAVPRGLTLAYNWKSERGWSTMSYQHVAFLKGSSTWEHSGGPKAWQPYIRSRTCPTRSIGRGGGGVMNSFTDLRHSHLHDSCTIGDLWATKTATLTPMSNLGSGPRMAFPSVGFVPGIMRQPRGCIPRHQHFPFHRRLHGLGLRIRRIGPLRGTLLH